VVCYFTKYVTDGLFFELKDLSSIGRVLGGGGDRSDTCMTLIADRLFVIGKL
jgi:hypothetical protein